MKIVCDCGNEIELTKSGTLDEFNSENAHYDYGKATISAEHDEFWITCNKCGQSVHIFA
jgi:Fe2+ or Zn2+ uptake regulation protein